MSILNLIAQGENNSIEFKQVEVRPPFYDAVIGGFRFALPTLYEFKLLPNMPITQDNIFLRS